MADPRIESWIKGAVGRGMDLDGAYKYQCVDVIDDYGQTLFGDWTKTVGYGDAKDLFDVMPTTYWTKIRNDPSKPNQLPQRGDVIVWPAWNGNPPGHIAVVESADNTQVHVIQQNGLQNTKPAHRATYDYVLGGVLPIGWLRPKLTEKKVQSITPEEVVALSLAVRGNRPNAQEAERFVGKEFTQKKVDEMITYFAQQSRIKALTSAFQKALAAKDTSSEQKLKDIQEILDRKG